MVEALWMKSMLIVGWMSYNESVYICFQASECLERAIITMDFEEKERLVGKKALDLLVKVPEATNLLVLCWQFEDFRLVSI